MAKKIFISLAIIILSLCCGVCFAAENNDNVNLGQEITDSLDKTGDSVRNVAEDVMNGVDGNNRNMGNNNNNNTNHNTTNTNRNRNAYTDNNAFSNGYNAVRTSVDDTATGNMSTTTWVWIILAVVAIVIVGMVWYYAVQNNNDKD